MYEQFIQPDIGARTGMQLDAANSQLDKAERMALVKTLSLCLDQLYDKCPVCWALGDQRVNRHPHMFVQCADILGIAITPNNGEWIDFKRTTQPKGGSVQYCYGCGSPMGGYMPECHRRHQPGKTCPWNDFMGVTLWVIFNDRVLHEAVKALLPETCSTLDQFALWCSREVSRARFCNGLDVFLWFCKYRGLM